MAKFYRSAFGWQTRMLGEDMGNYVIATTTETGEEGPKKPGAINGGFYAKDPAWPAQHPSWQAFSAQQGCPGPPHETKVPSWQTVPPSALLARIT